MTFVHQSHKKQMWAAFLPFLFKIENTTENQLDDILFAREHVLYGTWIYRFIDLWSYSSLLKHLPHCSTCQIKVACCGSWELD